MRSKLIYGCLLSAWLTSCGNHTATPGAVARWEKAFGRRTVTFRKVAEASSPRCLKDRLALDYVKEDVAKLEARAAAVSSGTWNGLDLSRLPAPQAAYLKAFDPWIEKRDFSRCQDLPCVLNAVYGTGEEAGWKIYLWYLRTGYGIGAAGHFPSWAPDEKGLLQKKNTTIENAKLESYLFDVKELDAFLRVSWTLPSFYFRMTSLQSFHRIPRGMNLTDWAAGNTCGTFVGHRLSGDIRLQDGCLTLDPKALDLKSYIYVQIAHEMSHALDAMSGKEPDWFTSAVEWTGLSGWRSQLPVDPKGNSVAMSWVYDKERAKFVTDYAATSPREDFAETMSHFRYQGDEVKRKTPEKFSFVQGRFFGGRDYSTEGIRDYLAEATAEAVASRAVDVVRDCVSGIRASASTATPAEQLDQCLLRGLDQSISRKMDELRATEYEACDVFGSDEKAFRGRLIRDLKPVVDQVLAQDKADTSFLGASLELRQALAAIDPREVYLHCYPDQDKHGCFDKKLSEAFASVSAPLAARLGQFLDVEKKAFLGQNDFDSAQKAFNELFRPALSELDWPIREAAQNRWTDCLASAGPESDRGGPLSTQPYSGSSQYVAAPILQCVNAAVMTDINAVQDRYLASEGQNGFRVSLDDPDLRSFFRDHTLANYLLELRVRTFVSAHDEDEERARREAGVVDVLVSQLRNGTKPSNQPACETLAENLFKQYFSKVGAEDLPPTRFKPIEAVRRTWSRAACLKYFNKK